MWGGEALRIFSVWPEVLQCRVSEGARRKRAKGEVMCGDLDVNRSEVLPRREWQPWLRVRCASGGGLSRGWNARLRQERPALEKGWCGGFPWATRHAEGRRKPGFRTEKLCP